MLLLLASALLALAHPDDNSLDNQNEDAAQAPYAASTGDVPPLTAASVPPELAPWVPWVEARHPELRCALTGESRSCLWPGELELTADDSGASFRVEVTVDRPLAVPLPGGKGAWPLSVKVDGAPGIVLDEAGVPALFLTEGAHRITGAYQWASMPQGIAVPASIARIKLSVDAEAVERPHLDQDGTLRLGAGDSRAPEQNQLEIDVSRKIIDLVPVRIETRLTLRASGAGREVNLGKVTLDGTRPVSIQAKVPTRFAENGDLIVQVRPGSWTVAFESLHEGPVTSLTAPTLAEPWPEAEFWVVATDDRTRAVNLTGPPGVDPARTTIPDEWRGLPTFRVDPATPLSFEELRRGEPSPAPNRLSLNRTLWLDLDGRGFTVLDRFDGDLHQGWRLDVKDPAVVGHVRANDEDQVITVGKDGTTGVELRQADVRLTAESRIEDRPLTLPAVGWDSDVTRLEATLNLPPGWSVLTGWGVDNLDGSVLDRWTLFDLFFVLVVSLATARQLGFFWGLVALVGLTVSRHEAPGTQWIFVLLLVGEWVSRRVSAGGWAELGANASRWALLVGLWLALADFSVDQLRAGWYPVLAPPRGADSSFSDVTMALGNLDSDDYSRGYGGSWASDAKIQQKESKKARLSSQVDPNSVVQTGTGIPNWTWKTMSLRWSGPVAADHRMGLVLLGPWPNFLLALTRVLFLAILGLRLLSSRPQTPSLPKAAAAPAAVVAGALALVVSLLGSGVAQAEPSPAILADLEARMTAGPSCRPACATSPDLRIDVSGDQLVIEAEVHAGDDASWPAPGPATVWVPERVLIDGVDSFAMARQDDGFIHVRLTKGVHTVRLEGRLPAGDAFPLQLGLPPKHLSWSAEGWTVDGVKADGSVEGSVQITRVLAGSGDGNAPSGSLSPWLEVKRTLDLGMPWRVQTEVLRVGPADAPVSVRVPLLPGETVTDANVEAQGTQVLATLARDQTSLSWISTLAETPSLTLTAPTGVPWTEEWTLLCSPIFACSHQGPAPLQHVVDGEWSPRWRPWPGESVTVAVSRPDAAVGQTITVDNVRFTVTPGRRQLEAQLELHILTSQGGTRVITLPPEAKLQTARFNGEERPIQARNGNQVHLPLRPGPQDIVLTWLEPHASSIFDWAPLVDIGGPAVNTTVVIKVPEERWIALIGGPAWGPVPMIWTYVLLVFIGATMARFLPFQTLSWPSWVMLGLGLTQIPVELTLVVALWFVAIGYRARNRPAHWAAHDLVQLTLLSWTAAVAILLYVAIHAGLLWDPDLQVGGNGSSDRSLVFFVDHVEAIHDGSTYLPRPLAVTLPMWVWRIGMLLWSLWLAAAMLSWLPWAFKALGNGGWFELPPTPPPKKKSTGGPTSGGKAAEAAPEPAPSPAPAAAPVVVEGGTLVPEAFQSRMASETGPDADLGPEPPTEA
jgi:hypothetical protein